MYPDRPRCNLWAANLINSIQGGHQVGNSIASIRQFYDLGVRYITTTHNCDNAFATSAVGRKDRGLLPFGHEYVKEMNRLGMMIDLSHVSHQTMRDVLSITQAPVIFSHSGAYSVQRHLRHVPDDVLREVKKNGGIVMVTFINRFLNMEDPDSATIQDVVDHIFHIAEVAGWESLGVGGDYSGTPECPIGLEVRRKKPSYGQSLLLYPSLDLERPDINIKWYRTYQNIPILLPLYSNGAPRMNKYGFSLEKISSVFGAR